MPLADNYYGQGPEALVVSLAGKGDRQAFAELVRRRQSWIRNLMRRCCGDNELADDLAQQVFLRAWRKIRQVREPQKFAGWLKRLAINVWIQHQRKNDPLWSKRDDEQISLSHHDTTAIALDLDKALATLPGPVRLCIVLSYQEGMTHSEISAATGLQPGTVKSHIRRGSARMRDLLSAYGESA